MRVAVALLPAPHRGGARHRLVAVGECRQPTRQRIMQPGVAIQIPVSLSPPGPFCMIRPLVREAPSIIVGMTPQLAKGRGCDPGTMRCGAVEPVLIGNICKGNFPLTCAQD